MIYGIEERATGISKGDFIAQWHTVKKFKSYAQALDWVRKGNGSMFRYAYKMPRNCQPPRSKVSVGKLASWVVLQGKFIA